MGHRKLESVLVYDGLKPGDDPSYELDKPADIWYLGLAGEIAANVKSSKITLPMLSKDEYDWKELLTKAIEEAVSLLPQRHVSCLSEAITDFTKGMYDIGIDDPHESQPAIWLSNKETRGKLCKSIPPYENTQPVNNYFVERQGLVADGIAKKIVVLIPEREHFGVLSTNEDYVNFFFIQDMIKVYYLKDLSIDPKPPIHGGRITLTAGTGSSPGGEVVFNTGSTGPR